MSELKAGDVVEIQVKARVECTYGGGRALLRWDSGEEIMLPSDVRLNND